MFCCYIYVCIVYGNELFARIKKYQYGYVDNLSRTSRHHAELGRSVVVRTVLVRGQLSCNKRYRISIYFVSRHCFFYSERDSPTETVHILDRIMSFCQWSGGEKYRSHFEPGIYVCSVCGNELFASTKKYEHSSPWPAFTETLKDDSVVKHQESPKALKVHCARCNNGLGHEFLGDGPRKGQSRF